MCPTQGVAGFTLTEVLVAVAVFFLVVINGMTLTGLQWKIIRKTQERIYITTILETRMEELRDLGYEQIEELANTLPFSVDPGKTYDDADIATALDSEEFKRPLTNAVGTIYITDVDTDLKKLVVEISWQAAGGSDVVSMSLPTYISRSGIHRQ